MILIDPYLDKPLAPVVPSGAKLPSVRSLARFLTEAQTAVRLLGEVTVLLTTDAAMRDLNRRFRGKNKPTDVLSFPASNPVGKQKKSPQKVAGDLAISAETALKQSIEQGHALTVEIKILVLHGLLHLAGYDHEIDTGQMQRREQRLRKQLGLPLGLIERAISKPVDRGGRGGRPGKPARSRKR